VTVKTAKRVASVRGTRRIAVQAVLAEILIAFTELSCKFHKPSFVGDTLYPQIQVAELTSNKGVGTITGDQHQSEGRAVDQQAAEVHSQDLGSKA
jgi:acyl dehydratase